MGRRTISLALAVALISYGLWLAHSDHDYRNTIVWLGGGAGLAGFAAACVAATTRRRYVWVMAAGAVLIAATLAGLLVQAYTDGSLTWNSCSRNCEPDGVLYVNPYAGLAFVYLANLFGWAIGAALGLGVRSGPGPVSSPRCPASPPPQSPPAR